MEDGVTGIDFNGAVESTASNNVIRNNTHWGIAVRESRGCDPNHPWDCFYATGNVISQNQSVDNGWPLDLYHHPQAIGNLWANNVCKWKEGIEIPPCGDADGDGVTDGVDNCPFTYNPAQTDTDDNGIGDACHVKTPADLSGTIKTADETDICAMVLASGQYTFSCNPVGLFSLSGLLRQTDGTVKRQIYAHGFMPKIDTLRGSTTEAVTMAHSGVCPNYNIPYDPGFHPGSAGKWIDIAGKVLLQYTDTPICAMVLANGQYMFSCDGSGSYALNIPLDNNGQFKLQVYADGFAPVTQTFDEFQPINDVRMAQAVECQ
jgi:parallel beta-helix repeat protein